MAKKTTDQVLAIVMAYGPDPRNKFLDDPQGDAKTDINPVLATMEDEDFDPFFIDFTQYIHGQDGLEDLDITDHALRNCKKWVSLANVVFNAQT